ncbi:hypothetical protein LTR95_014577 [Oleoguttula sp. CCFEE 5521]
MNPNAPNYGDTPEGYPHSDGCNTNNLEYGVSAQISHGQRLFASTALESGSPVGARVYDGGPHGMTGHHWGAPQAVPNTAWPYTPSGSDNLSLDLPNDGYNTFSTGISSLCAGTGQSGSSYTMSDTTGQSSPTPMMLRDSRGFQDNFSNWKTSAPHARSVVDDSDNESLELDDKHRDLVDRFVDLMMSTGEDPSESKKARAKIEQLAHLSNIDVFRVWHYLGQRSVHIGTVARVPAPSTPVMPSIVPFDAQPASRQESILVIVDRYVSSHSTPCAAGPYDTPAEDAFQCIWPNCNYSHKKEAQWKRHVELRRPQSVYVCCLCFDLKLKLDSIFRDYRKDKLLTHLTAHGLAKGDRRREHVAQASCQSVAETYTQDCGRMQGSRACQFQSKTWSEYITHAAGHIKQDIAAARRASVESGSSSSRESLDEVGPALQVARKRSSVASKRVTGGSAQTSPRGRKKAKK